MGPPPCAAAYKITTGDVAHFATLASGADHRPDLANSAENSDLAQMRDFACPLTRIAHLRHEGIAAYAENLAQEPRSAFAQASR